MRQHHHQHMQLGMHGFGTPQTIGPGLGPVPFLTMPGPPPPAIGLGSGPPTGGGIYSHSMSVSSASEDPVGSMNISVRYGDNVVRSIPPPSLHTPQPTMQGPGRTQGADSPSSRSSPAVVRTSVTLSTPTSPAAAIPGGPTPQASTRTPVYVHNSLPSLRANTNTNTSVINGNVLTSPGSTNILGQAPADPHGFHTARSIHRDYASPTAHTTHGPIRDNTAPGPGPSVLGGPRMGSFLQEYRAAQERMRGQVTASTHAYALGQARAQTASTLAAASRAHNAAINAAANRAGLLISSRVSSRLTNTAATTAAVPTSGPLLTILIASLKDCLGYDSVAAFAKSNYPHLMNMCYAKPRFLCAPTRVSAGPPSPLTMDTVMQRLVTEHISAEQLRRLDVPDWEGYMLLALELKWLETGMVVGGFGGDVVERIWEAEEDRGGTGRGGRYTEEDVRRRLEARVWLEVERRFLRRLIEI